MRGALAALSADTISVPPSETEARINGERQRDQAGAATEDQRGRRLHQQRRGQIHSTKALESRLLDGVGAARSSQILNRPAADGSWNLNAYSPRWLRRE